MKTILSTTVHAPDSIRRRSQESEVLAWIIHAPQTLKTLHQLTGIAKSTITARLTDLQKRGVVVGFETTQENRSNGRLVNVTVYDYEPDEHRQIDHGYNFRRNLDIKAIEGCLNRKSPVYPPFLIASMRRFLGELREAGALDSDYKIPGE